MFNRSENLDTDYDWTARLIEEVQAGQHQSDSD